MLHCYPVADTFFVSNVTFRAEATTAIQSGQEQLQLLKRQVVMGKLYPSTGSVMDSTVSIA